MALVVLPLLAMASPYGTTFGGARRTMLLPFGVQHSTTTVADGVTVNTASCLRPGAVLAFDTIDLDTGLGWWGEDPGANNRQAARQVPPNSLIETVWYTIQTDTSVAFATGESLTIGVFFTDYQGDVASFDSGDRVNIGSFTLSESDADFDVKTVELNHSAPTGGLIMICAYANAGGLPNAKVLNSVASILVSVP